LGDWLLFLLPDGDKIRCFNGCLAQRIFLICCLPKPFRMTTFFDKLKENFIVLTVGILIGIPALGILLPNLFSFLSSSGAGGRFDLSCVFKVFTMLYFSLPFLLLMLLVLLQFKGQLGIGVREDLAIFMGGLTFSMALTLIQHGLNVGHNERPMLIAPIICMLALGYYIFSIWKKLRKIDIRDIAIWHFHIFFILVPIQSAVSILLTSFPDIEGSGTFVLSCLVLYCIPLIIYLSHRSVQWLRGTMQKRKAYVFIVLVLLPILLTVILFFSHSPKEAWGYSWPDSETRYKGYFRSSNQLDSMRRVSETVEKLQKISLINKKKAALDSLFSSYSADGWKKTELFHAGNEYQKFFKSIEEVHFLEVSYFSVRPAGRDNDSTLRVRQDSLLKTYADYLHAQYDATNDLGKFDLLALVRKTQKMGAIVFISAILILLAILSVFYFDQEAKPASKILSLDQESAKPAEDKDRPGIRYDLQVSLLVILVLFIPLIKHVTAKELDPQQPFKLYEVRNWNLANAVTPAVKDEYTRDTIIVSLKDSCARPCCEAPAEIEPAGIFTLEKKLEQQLTVLNTMLIEIRSREDSISLNNKIAFYNWIRTTPASLDRLADSLGKVIKNTHDNNINIAIANGRLEEIRKLIAQLNLTVQNISLKPNMSKQ